MFRISNKYTFLICFLFGLILNSCSYSKTDITLSSLFDSTWDFENTNSYEFDNNLVEIKNGKAQLKALDLTHSGADLINGSHVGTQVFNSNTVLLNTGNNSADSDNKDHRQILASRSANLVGYWRFDTNFNDSSGSQNHGVARDNAIISGFGVSGGSSAKFDGADDAVVVTGNNLDGFAEMTLGGWYWAESSDQFDNLLNKCDASSSNTNIVYRLTVDSAADNPYILVRNQAQTSEYANAYAGTQTYGQWQFIVAKYDGSNLNMYINGILHSTEAASLGSLATFAANNPLVIGDNCYQPSGGSFEGYIDEVFIYDIALNDNEILKLYHSQVEGLSQSTFLHPSWAPKWGSIVGYWKMDRNWQDSSGNNNHGTAVNGPTFTERKVGASSMLGNVNLAGTGDYLSVSPSSELNSTGGLSVSAWVKPISFSEHGLIVRNGTSNDQQYAVYITQGSGRLNFSWYDGTYNGVTAPAGAELNVNEWSHIVVTRSSTQNLTFYVNGEIVHTGNSVLPTALGGELVIGANFVVSNQDYDGQVDDLAIWDVPLSSSDVLQIYNRQKQQYASHYDSEVIDLGSSTSIWPDLSWSTSLPFGKELVGDFDNDGIPDIESLSDYMGLSGHLSNGLAGYWPLNEKLGGSAPGLADYADISGANNHLTTGGSAVYGETGKFLAAFSTDALTSGHAQVNNGIVNTSDSFTVAAWVMIRDVNLSAGNRTAVSQQGSTYPAYFLGMDGVSKRPRFSVCDSDSPAITCSFAYGQNPMENHRWYLFVSTYNSSTQKIELYVDGESLGEQNGRAVFNATTKFEIGRSIWNSTITDRWPGSIDNIAVWNRVLSSLEVQQLYRRGANRVKLQVKSCVDSSCNCKSYGAGGDATDCDGDTILNTVDTDDIHKSEFIGPGGDGTTYFSELYNRQGTDISFQCALNTTDDNIGICVPDEISFTGSSKPTGPEFLNIDYAQYVNPLANRYAQYRVYMEADDNKACGGEPCLPELSSVSLNPGGAIKYASDYVEIKPASSINFTKLIDAKIKASACARFRLARGASQYYHDGIQWEPVTLTTQNNTASEVTSNVLQFGTQHGAGSLQVVGYLKSDVSGTSQCTIDEIDINFQ